MTQANCTACNSENVPVTHETDFFTGEIVSYVCGCCGAADQLQVIYLPKTEKPKAS